MGNSSVAAAVFVVLFAIGCNKERSTGTADPLYADVTRILTHQWNPTNQPPEILAKYDYSSYTPGVLKLLSDGANGQQVSDYLLHTETSNMKLDGDQARCDTVARALVEARSKQGEGPRR